MNKIIVEVGSTVTKADEYDGKILNRIGEKTIFFKKNYKENNYLLESDVEKLINYVNELKEKTEDIYVCGTSIFRSLTDLEKEEFLNNFKSKTGLDFHIISSDDECKLTVLGATRFIDNACVFIGGGGSTEIAIYDRDIVENTNSQIGVMDVTEVFPDLASDIASASLDEVMDYIKARLILPKKKSDVLILAGGAHEMFVRVSGIKYDENTLYEDDAAPIMMDIESRIAETKRYYEEISLDEIRARVDDPDWWYGTRAMCAFALVVALKIGAKVIIPTNIGMAYGILKEN